VRNRIEVTHHTLPIVSTFPSGVTITRPHHPFHGQSLEALRQARMPELHAATPAALPAAIPLPSGPAARSPPPSAPMRRHFPRQLALHALPVGIHIFTFEACSNFTRVTACWVPQPHFVGAIARPRSGRFPGSNPRKLLPSSIG
jgi:hypothetical protein